jgi:PQQ-like domain
VARRLPQQRGWRLYLHDGLVYVAGAGGFAYAIDVNTGALGWHKTGYTSAFGGAYCGGSFFMDEEYLIRFDAATGNQTGKLAAACLDFSSDLATDDTAVYLTGPDGAYRVACR